MNILLHQWSLSILYSIQFSQSLFIIAEKCMNHLHTITVLSKLLNEGGFSHTTLSDQHNLQSDT